MRLLNGASDLLLSSVIIPADTSPTFHSMACQCRNCLSSLKNTPLCSQQYRFGCIVPSAQNAPSSLDNLGKLLFILSNTFHIVSPLWSPSSFWDSDILSLPPHRANQLITTELPWNLVHTFTLARESSRASLYFWRVGIMARLFISVAPISKTVLKCILRDTF